MFYGIKDRLLSIFWNSFISFTEHVKGGGIHFLAVTFEVSFLSVITKLPVSVIYHPKAYAVNFQNSHIILIWLPWQRY